MQDSSTGKFSQQLLYAVYRSVENQRTRNFGTLLLSSSSSLSSQGYQRYISVLPFSPHTILKPRGQLAWGLVVQWGIYKVRYSHGGVAADMIGCQGINPAAARPHPQYSSIHPRPNSKQPSSHTYSTHLCISLTLIQPLSMYYTKIFALFFH